MADENPSLARNLLGKLLFVVGVLILLAFLAWAILKIVPKVVSSVAGLGGSVSGLFASSEVTASVSPQTVDSGEGATLKWSYRGSQDGKFSVSYACQDGLTVTIQNGGSAKTLVCGTGYALGSKGGDALVTAKLAKTGDLADVDFTVAYESKSGETLAEDSALLTVTSGGGNGYGGADRGDEAATEGTVDSGSSKSAGGSATTYAHSSGGASDLVVLDPAMGSNGRLEFTVANFGGSATGVWYFTYTTPTDRVDTFVSPAMMSLAPGESLRVGVRFGEIDSGTHRVVIVADPYGRIAEASEANNSFAVDVRGSGSSSSSSGHDDANLEVRDFEVGYMDGSRFRDGDSIDENDEAAVRFVVRNTGDEDTGSWRYEVRDPDGDWQRSSRQDSLEPGEEVEITEEFGELDSGDYTIKVKVDSDDDVDEEDEDDNDDSADLEVKN